MSNDVGWADGDLNVGHDLDIKDVVLDFILSYVSCDGMISTHASHMLYIKLFDQTQCCQQNITEVYTLVDPFSRQDVQELHSRIHVLENRCIALQRLASMGKL